MPSRKKPLSKFASSSEAQPSIENASNQEQDYNQVLEEKFLMEQGDFAEKFIATLPPSSKKSKVAKSTNVDEAVDRLESLVDLIQAGKSTPESTVELNQLIGDLVRLKAMTAAESGILKKKFSL
jgi:hypothetical protein